MQLTRCERWVSRCESATREAQQRDVGGAGESRGRQGDADRKTREMSGTRRKRERCGGVRHGREEQAEMRETCETVQRDTSREMHEMEDTAARHEK